MDIRTRIAAVLFSLTLLHSLASASETIVATGTQEVVTALLWTQLPINLNVKNGSQSLALCVCDIRFDGSISATTGLAIAIAYPQDASPNRSVLGPAEVGKSVDSIADAALTRATTVPWLIAMRLQLKVSGTHVIWSVYNHEIVKRVRQGDAPSAQVMQTIAAPNFQIKSVQLESLKLQVSDKVALPVNLRIQFGGASLALSGAVSPAVPILTAPTTDLEGTSSRTQVSIDLLNGISKSAYQSDTVDLDAGSTKVKLNQFQFQTSGDSLFISARVQSAKPACEIRVRTTWTGSDLMLDDVQLEDTSSLRTGACALEKGKWGLVAASLKSLYHNLPLRPTRLQTINTVVGGQQVKVLVMVKRASVKQSTVVFVGDVWLGSS